MFALLDGRIVTAAGGRWRLDVFSVCDHEGSRWIQLALDGEPRYALTMRLSPREGIRHGLFVLAGWLANPGGYREILSVA
jgi:hypothetical protein